MTKTTSVKLKCEECGHVFPIARKMGKTKKEGHIKHLWCIQCKAETGHIEQDSRY